MELLANQVALVTGASRGIGKAIALELAKHGAKVWVNYQKSEQAAAAVVQEIQSLGKEAIAIQASVAEEAEVIRMFQQIEQAGKLDILVCNAGITKDQPLLRMSVADFDQVLNTNLRGTFLCLKLAGKMMLRKRYGRVITISSVSGLMGNPGQASYSASKAGIIALTKTFAREFAKADITANVVAPGYIQSDMTQVLSTEIQEKMLQYIPKGQFGKPEDVAPLVRFLASNESSYITGQVFSPNGGLVM